MFATLKSLVILLALVLSGCAATVNRPSGEGQSPLSGKTRPSAISLLITGDEAMQQSADWQTFRAEWRSAFSASASAAGLNATYLETEPPDQPPDTVLVFVAVNDYRYITPAARFGFGIMTGNAFVDADAEFFEFPNRRSIGKRKYSTSSTAWQGVFSAMTDKQVRAISDTMLQELLQR